MDNFALDCLSLRAIDLSTWKTINGISTLTGDDFDCGKFAANSPSTIKFFYVNGVKATIDGTNINVTLPGGDAANLTYSYLSDAPESAENVAVSATATGVPDTYSFTVDSYTVTVLILPVNYVELSDTNNYTVEGNISAVKALILDTMTSATSITETEVKGVVTAVYAAGKAFYIQDKDEGLNVFITGHGLTTADIGTEVSFKATKGQYYNGLKEITEINGTVTKGTKGRTVYYINATGTALPTDHKNRVYRVDGVKYANASGRVKNGTLTSATDSTLIYKTTATGNNVHTAFPAVDEVFNVYAPVTDYKGAAQLYLYSALDQIRE